MPEKICRLPSSPASSSKRSSLSEPSTNSQATTLPTRRSSLEVVDADGGDARPGSALRRRGGSRHRRFRRGCGRGFRRSYRGFRGRGGLQVFLAGFGHGGNLLRVDTGEQRAVRPDGVVEQRRVDVAPGCQRRVEELFDIARHRRKHRRSEEHKSELQSLMRISYAVFCLKKQKKLKHNINE